MGSIITSNGINMTTSTVTSAWLLTNPFRRPGVLRLRSVLETYRAVLPFPLQASQQGIHTCSIPDDNGNIISLNVGLYPYGFNGETLLQHSEYIASFSLS